MHHFPTHPAPPLPDSPIALFLDIDGTIAPLASTPQDARIPGETLAILRMLRQYTNGSVALISGRNLADIDRISDDVFPAAGQHGLELRTDSTVEAGAHDTGAMTEVAKEIRHFTDSHPLLLVEDKGLSVAVHYRRAPELAAMVEEKLSSLAAHHADRLCLQRGKMVAELRMAGGGKGNAIQRLLRTPAFAGKMPVFAGDDSTDEDGFIAVNALHGMSIKIGGGESVAQWRVASVEDFTSWLRCLALHLTPQAEVAA
jgi:trehalose 6-phosphate phosphatase